MRTGGDARGDRPRDIVCDPERNRRAPAVRFAPSVGDDASAFAAFGEAIFNAITIRRGDNEGVAFPAACA